MKSEVTNRHTLLAAADRRRYDREVVILEQNAERALCLHPGTLANLRALSDPSHEGRRARREWLFLVTRYVELVNPTAPEILEPEGVGIAGETYGDVIPSSGDVITFGQELRALLSSPRRVITILAVIAVFWLILVEIHVLM